MQWSPISATRSLVSQVVAGVAVLAGDSSRRGSFRTAQSNCDNEFVAIRHTCLCHLIVRYVSDSIPAQYEPQFQLPSNWPCRSRGHHRHDGSWKYALLLGGRLCVTNETVRSPYLTVPHSESQPMLNSLAHLQLRVTHNYRWTDRAETPNSLYDWWMYRGLHHGRSKSSRPTSQVSLL